MDAWALSLRTRPSSSGFGRGSRWGDRRRTFPNRIVANDCVATPQWRRNDGQSHNGEATLTLAMATGSLNEMERDSLKKNSCVGLLMLSLALMGCELPYFTRLPRRSLVIEVDAATATPKAPSVRSSDDDTL